jgi:hypothetical protein
VRGGPDLGAGEDAAVAVEGAHDDAREQTRAAALEVDQMRGAVGQDLVARTRVDLDRDLVAHGAGGQVDGGFLAEQLGHHLLQPVHGRILALLLVAHFRLAHEAPHVRGGLGQGIAVEIDHDVVLRGEWRD